MSYYTEKNGLAQFWNRDNTRMEWAKWVYHHPEQTQELINRLIETSSDELDLSEIKEDIVALENELRKQQQTIIQIQNRPIDIMSDEDIDEITGVNLNG